MLLASALLLSLVSGCGQGQGAASQAAMPYPRESVELVAPAGVRSGSDLTLRNVAQCLCPSQTGPETGEGSRWTI